MQKILFIFNPHAGKTAIKNSLSDILNILTAQGYLVTAYPTQAPGDAGEAVTSWGSEFDRIIVAGGDGTLNEAVTGLLRLPARPPMGYIPCGTTNDFSRNLNLPSTMAELAKTAAHGVPRPCDVGRFNGRPFLYVAAFGAFTEASYNTPQHVKNLLGYTAYLLESVKLLGSIKPYAIKVTYDGQEVSGNFIYGMVSNTTSVGRFRNFPPGNPELDDGLLEVTLISPPKDILELEQFGRSLLLSDPAVKSPMMHTFSAAKVEISCEEELLWTLDGEYGGPHVVAEIEVDPKAFTIIHGK